ncbi:hypothetical protein SCHPADRAFT_484221 [Schizopora paradoxa]|uniref:Zn(2)-C6 fungal-type domain-containing protein n=1 Tax=Schizopora paradoxa TaxID=27342 RepID=A0A0H2RH09_9AGAM|nr:hypothetical protein SCHPADRAFT_484221 [Schizopora paradoxa]
MRSVSQPSTFQGTGQTRTKNSNPCLNCQNTRRKLRCDGDGVNACPQCVTRNLQCDYPEKFTTYKFYAPNDGAASQGHVHRRTQMLPQQQQPIHATPCHTDPALNLYYNPRAGAGSSVYRTQPPSNNVNHVVSIGVPLGRGGPSQVPLAQPAVNGNNYLHTSQHHYVPPTAGPSQPYVNSTQTTAYPSHDRSRRRSASRRIHNNMQRRRNEEYSQACLNAHDLFAGEYK